jgi:catechol 2,3-dioxygenase-like lactoylglutathione lyase family enzyme
VKLRAPDYLVVIVQDLDRSLAFYTGVLGLRLGHRSGEYAQLRTGTTRLALYTRAAMERTLGAVLRRPDLSAPAFEIGFKVSDVDAAFAELVASGAPSAAPPTDRFWGQRTAYIRDPDGHLIELAQDLRGS